MNDSLQGEPGISPGDRFRLAVWLVLSVLAAVAGLVFFIILFIPDFNMYWLVISPIILAFYEAPAVFLFWLYKKKKAALLNPDIEED